jgi:hypothetical protein
MGYEIFQKQHFGLKCVTIFTAIIAILFLSYPNLLYLFIGFVIYLLYSPELYLKWLQSFLKMTYFWISFFLLGMLFQIPFKTQFYTFFRIFFLFGLSIYFVATVDLKQFLCQKTKRNGLQANIVRYLFLTFHFIPMFVEQYKEDFDKQKSPLIILENVLQKCFQKASNVEIEYGFSQRFPFYSYANFYLSLFLLFVIIILAR